MTNLVWNNQRIIGINLKTQRKQILFNHMLTQIQLLI